MVILGVQRLYALQTCAIHKGIALLIIIYGADTFYVYFQLTLNTI